MSWIQRGQGPVAPFSHLERYQNPSPDAAYSKEKAYVPPNSREIGPQHLYPIGPKKKNNTFQSEVHLIGKRILLTLQILVKKSQRGVSDSLTAISQGIINLHMDHRLRKLVINQCMNRNIHRRLTLESCRCANGSDRLRKGFCHCLCEEHEKGSNGKSRELHFVNLVSEMGFFRWWFCPFFTNLLIPRLKHLLS